MLIISNICFFINICTEVHGSETDESNTTLVKQSSGNSLADEYQNSGCEDRQYISRYKSLDNIENFQIFAKIIPIVKGKVKVHQMAEQKCTTFSSNNMSPFVNNFGDT